MLNVVNGMVNIYGILFPAELIDAAMFETGGKVVVQRELVDALDKARKAAEGAGKKVEVLTLSHVPMVYFIPRRILLHRVLPSGMIDPQGTKTERYLYFAVKKVFSAGMSC